MTNPVLLSKSMPLRAHQSLELGGSLFRLLHHVFDVNLQLGLFGDGRQHEVTHVLCSLVEVVRHAVTAEVLADDVELDAVLVDHICDTVTMLVNVEWKRSSLKAHPQPWSMT